MRQESESPSLLTVFAGSVLFILALAGMLVLNALPIVLTVAASLWLCRHFGVI